MDNILKQIGIKFEKENIITDADMREYTSFKAGGKAMALITPKNTIQLRYVLKMIGEHEHMIIGNGTNILVRDGGYPGFLIKIGEAFSKVKVEGDKIQAGAGASLAKIAKQAAKHGLTGFEFASGIPGSLGGAVFMNAGAYDGEMKDVISEVNVISKSGHDRMTFKNEEMNFGYRSSMIQDTGYIVTGATIQLKKGNKDEILAKMKDFNDRRNSKQPIDFPSAGSTFKRPEGHFVGKLMTDANIKGLTMGGAQISDLHGGFIINKGNATASDIIHLIHIAQAVIQENFGVKLETEVRIIGVDKE